jgi:two-component system nitrogen regulation response regulator GlnG
LQDFAGNVRQLENLCHWLTVMAPGVSIDIADLPPELREAQHVDAAQSWISALEREAETALNRGQQNIMHEMTRQFERALIQKALAHTGGRRIEASHLLGLGRNTLTRKIQELEIEGKDSDAPESAA